MQKKAKPIIFSAPMVRALLDGRKTQTRRVQKKQSYFGVAIVNPPHATEQCPYGRPGDLLWVRETFAYVSPDEIIRPICECDIEYRANLPFSCDDGPGGYERGDSCRPRWNPSIHMPRTASRITLKITDIRVERLQDISEEDARAEGCKAEFWKTNTPDCYEHDGITAVQDYSGLWESIHGPGSWQENPWVWAVSFKVIRENVDKVLSGE